MTPALGLGLGAVAVALILSRTSSRGVGGLLSEVADMAGTYFSFSELTRRRDGRPQSLTASQATALRRLTSNVLDPLREATGPITVTSGFRSDEYNDSVAGAASNSQHERGEAVDVRPPDGFDSISLARKVVAMGLPFDQLIAYHPSRGGHLHISHRSDGAQRGEVRHAPSGSTSEPIGLPDSWKVS